MKELEMAQGIYDLFVAQWGSHSPMAKEAKAVLECMKAQAAENETLREVIRWAAEYAENFPPATELTKWAAIARQALGRDVPLVKEYV